MTLLSPFQIIYEDNHQIVVNKPAGMLTQPDNTGQDSLEVLLKAWIKERDQKPGNVFLGTVHRLDKPVSGVVLFARTSKALSRLNEALRNKQSQKTYLALVEGVPSKPQATLENYLTHDNHQARVSNQNDPEAKVARLHYKLISEHKGLALLEINLETGRYHQIRVQLSAIGHPIVGDAKYGSHKRCKEGAIALHHHRLQVPHPVTGILQTFETPIPSYWP